MQGLCFTPQLKIPNNGVILHNITTNRNRKPSISATMSKSKPEVDISSTAEAKSMTAVLQTREQPPAVLRVSPSSLQYESGELGAVPDHKVQEGNGAMSEMEYLTNICPFRTVGVNVWLKREDLQPVNCVVEVGGLLIQASRSIQYDGKAPKEQLAKGVICSSAGNHAQGVALSAKTLGCDAVIVMPVTTPRIKWESVKRLGATVVLEGDSYDEAQAYAKRRGESENRTFIPPFDHPDIITGQGTVGMEIVHQMQGPIHAIFVPVGGGGLIAGLAAYVKRVSPEVSTDYWSRAY
ncbi:putative threonine ammonia-lyase [Helianthus annuus]|nr:putative threonine ammonia-lyase [Helianthus annuus]